MPIWIVEIGKQLNDPVLLFALVVVWLMYRLLDKER